METLTQKNLADGIAANAIGRVESETGRVNPAQGNLVREQRQAKARHSGSTDSSRVNRPVSLKQFLAEEAQRLGLSTGAIFARIQRGKYAGKIKLRRVTKRTVIVEEVKQ